MTPQRIIPEDVKDWHKSSLELMKRKLVSIIAILFVYLAIVFGIKYISLHEIIESVIIMNVVLLFMTSFVVIAYQADHTEPVYLLSIWKNLFSKQYYPRIFAFFGILSVAAIGMMLIGLLVANLINFLIDPASPTPTTETISVTIESEFLRYLLFILFWLFKCGSFIKIGMVIATLLVLMGFVWTIPLILFSELTAHESARKSHEAFVVSRLTFYQTLTTFCIWTVLISMYLPILWVFALPYYGVMIYISFKHIFLGKKQTEDVKVKTHELTPARVSS